MRFVTDFAQKHGYLNSSIFVHLESVFSEGKKKLYKEDFYIAGTGKSNCTSKVPFTYDFSISQYVIKSESDGLCVDHSHFVMMSAIDGVKQKKIKAELTTEKLDYIMEIGAFVPMCKLRRILRWRWPDTDYEDGLLHRIRNKGKQRAS